MRVLNSYQKKSRSVSSALFLYITFFILFHLTTSIVIRYYPGVLGITSAITVEDLVRLTNEQRTRSGLAPLQFSPALALAAAHKGENMFAEDYWAHVSPGGKDPWFWINQTGYEYIVAGENLAKDFVDPQSVVSAWMASPSHRTNILNSKYEELGMAVLEGNLNGYRTTLVVQMFATPRPVPRTLPKPVATVFPKEEEITPKPEVVALPAREAPQPVYTPTPKPVLQPTPLLSPQAFLVSNKEAQKRPPVIEPFYLVKIVSLSLVFLLLGIFAIDVWAVATHRVVRIGSHSLAHAALLGILLLAIIYTNIGVIA